uniref:Uncharacterized protein n=1 Tax=Amphimedon queenslandica TaxID=400682 RepID=A0A1X7VF76_AMPQE
MLISERREVWLSDSSKKAMAGTSNSSLWFFLSFLLGVTLGTVIGWKVHSRRNAWLRDRREFYKSKAAEAQERLDSS